MFIALTETWLREQKDAEVGIDGYTLFRQDRQRAHLRRTGRDSGGVACYIKSNLAAATEPVINYSNGVVEMLGLYVKSSNLLIIVMYRPPDDRIGGHCSTHIEFRQALSKLHDTLQDLPTPTPDIILCGDFNLPHAIWPGGGVKVGAARDEQIMIKDLLAFTDELFLVQEIQKPTHRKGNTLDLLFTNNPEFLHSYECVETIYSDHFMIEGCVNYNKEN